MLAYETEALATEAETKAFSDETEAKTKTFSIEAEARPRRLKFQPRRDRAEALLRLETASRPRRQDRSHIPEICRLSGYDMQITEVERCTGCGGAEVFLQDIHR